MTGRHHDGFISMLMLIMLASLCYIGKGLGDNVRLAWQFHQHDDLFYRANWIEVLTIGHVRQCFRDYTESDEEIFFDGFNVEISYDELQADITISQGDFVRERVLVYDDIDDTVVDYY